METNSFVALKMRLVGLLLKESRPLGTTKIEKEMRGKATLYTICLPYGYCFLYRAPVFNHDKSYNTFPRIAVLDELEVLEAE